MNALLKSANQRPASSGALIIGSGLMAASLMVIALVVIFSQVLLTNQARRQIAYYANAEGQGAVRLMDIDRWISADLFRVNDWVNALSWSPDGKQLAFITYENGYYFLNLMDADGKNEHRLTDHTASNQQPIWSDDSKVITFEAGGYLPYMAIFRIDTTGENVRALMENGGATSDLSWSPDGQQAALAAIMDDPNAFEIFVMDAGCVRENLPCQPERLTHHPADDRLPAWSPDGKRIAFLSNRDGKFEVYALDATCIGAPEGCEAQQLTHISVSSTSLLSWSPDSHWLSFEASINEVGSVIYVMDMTCENLSECPKTLHRLTSPQDTTTSATWSADSREIVYISRIDGTVLALLDVEACVQAGDGCPMNERRLTPAGDYSWYPVWRP